GNTNIFLNLHKARKSNTKMQSPANPLHHSAQQYEERARSKGNLPYSKHENPRKPATNERRETKSFNRKFKIPSKVYGGSRASSKKDFLLISLVPRIV